MFAAYHIFFFSIFLCANYFSQIDCFGFDTRIACLARKIGIKWEKVRNWIMLQLSKNVTECAVSFVNDMNLIMEMFWFQT